MTHRFDLIIAGGGLVGMGFALALSDMPLKIALVEAQPPKQTDPRLFALNANSCQFLKNLDIWDALFPYAAPINQVHVSRRGYFGALRLSAESADEPLGYVIPAKYIEAALYQKLLTSSCQFFCPWRVIDFKHHTDFSSLYIQSNDKTFKLDAPFIIAADGTHSTLRKLVGVPSDEIDYQQSAIVTQTIVSKSHRQIAYERFVEKGAIAMLPLHAESGFLCATIWSTDTAHANALSQLDDEQFLLQLQAAFGQRLGQFTHINPRVVFPLKAIKAKTLFKDGVFFIGNAAHTLHPIAAQGFNLALFEVGLLVESINTHLQQGFNFNDYEITQIIKPLQNQIEKSYRVSHYLASKHDPVLTHLFQLGLIGAEKLPFIRTRLLNELMMKVGIIPSLLLGKDDHEYRSSGY